MNSTILDENFINSVVEHMNEDHADACLAIARHLGGQHKAVNASMLGMEASGVRFSTISAEGSEEQVHVLFDKPITRETQIRGHLVALAKRARAAEDAAADQEAS